jgi:hypothetical protein
MVHSSASAKHFKASQHWYILQIKYSEDNEWMDDHFVIGANTTINQSIFGRSHRSNWFYQKAEEKQWSWKTKDVKLIIT